MANCDFHLVAGDYECSVCGLRVPGAALLPIFSQCRLAVEGDAPQTNPIRGGPGTELAAIFASISVHEKLDCPCKSTLAQMDRWGATGCREHAAEIVQRLRDTLPLYNWREKLAAAAKAVTTGLAFKINWADPFPGLVELAIERAEEKAATAEATSLHENRSARGTIMAPEQ